MLELAESGTGQRNHISVAKWQSSVQPCIPSPLLICLEATQERLLLIPKSVLFLGLAGVPRLSLGV